MTGLRLALIALGEIRVLFDFRLIKADHGAPATSNSGLDIEIRHKLGLVTIWKYDEFRVQTWDIGPFHSAGSLGTVGLRHRALLYLSSPSRQKTSSFAGNTLLSIDKRKYSPNSKKYLYTRSSPSLVHRLGDLTKSKKCSCSAVHSDRCRHIYIAPAPGLSYFTADVFSVTDSADAAVGLHNLKLPSGTETKRIQGILILLPTVEEKNKLLHGLNTQIDRAKTTEVGRYQKPAANTNISQVFKHEEPPSTHHDSDRSYTKTSGSSSSSDSSGEMQPLLNSLSNISGT